MKIVIIIFSGGVSAGAIALGLFLLVAGGIAPMVKDYKEWNAIQAEAEMLLLPPSSYYDSVWYNSRAVAHFQSGNYSKAIKEFRKSFELYPNGATLNIIAATYYYSGDLDTAIDYWDVAAEAFPDYALLKQNLKNAQKARELNPSLKPTLTIGERQ